MSNKTKDQLIEENAFLLTHHEDEDYIPAKYLFNYMSSDELNRFFEYLRIEKDIDEIDTPDE